MWASAPYGEVVARVARDEGALEARSARFRTGSSRARSVRSVIELPTITLGLRGSIATPPARSGGRERQRTHRGTTTAASTSRPGRRLRGMEVGVGRARRDRVDARVARPQCRWRGGHCRPAVVASLSVIGADLRRRDRRNARRDRRIFTRCLLLGCWFRASREAPIERSTRRLGGSGDGRGLGDAESTASAAPGPALPRARAGSRCAPAPDRQGSFPTSSRTEAAERSNAVRSSGVSSISITRSMPSAPRTAGTPTNRPSIPYSPAR